MICQGCGFQYAGALDECPACDTPKDTTYVTIDRGVCSLRRIAYALEGLELKATVNVNN